MKHTMAVTNYTETLVLLTGLFFLNEHVNGPLIAEHCEEHREDGRGQDGIGQGAMGVREAQVLKGAPPDEDGEHNEALHHPAYIEKLV